MTGDDFDLLDEPFTSILAACDDAMAAGTTSGSLSTKGLAPELHSRLREDLACLQRLQQLRPRSWRSDTSIGFHGQDTPLPLLDAPRATACFGRFELQRELGRGGFGVVFLAHDPQLRRDVALKVPRLEVLSNPEVRVRFYQEARAAAGLDHPNIVPVYETGEVGPICYIASAYCPGITLAAWLQGHSGPVPPRAAAQLTAILSEAIQHAHSRGVLHRDLKPGNILLQKSEVRGQRSEIGSPSESTLSSSFHPLTPDPCPLISDLCPKITDFGLAKVMEQDFPADAKTQTGMVVGTPAYMAPEQATGRSRGITTAVDVYALGAILYELLTGRCPFQETSVLETLDAVRSRDPVPPRRMQPLVPHDLETICLKCLRKEPSRRYTSAHALAEDLNRFLAGEPIQARTAGKMERLSRWCRRNPALAAALGIVGFLVVLLTVGSFIAAVSYAEKRDAAVENLHLAEKADRELKEQLGRSFLEQSRAKRAGNQTGRRFESLDRLNDALQMFRSLGLESSYKEEIRNEAVACLVYADLRLTSKWNVKLAKPSSAALTRSMDRFAYQDENGTIVFHRRADNEEILRVPYTCPAGKWCSYMQFSPDGRFFVVKYEVQDSATGSEVRVWNVDRRDPGTGLPSAALVFQVPSEVPYVAMDFSPDSKYLAVGEWSGGIRVYDLMNGKGIKRWTQGKLPYRLAFDPDGQRLAAASPEAVVEIRDVDSGCITASLTHPEWVRGIAWSPNGRRLACAYHAELAVWDVATRVRLGLFRGHEGGAVDVAFNHAGDLLASGGWDGMVRLWEVASGRQLANCRGNYQYCLQFSPDDRYLGLAHEDGGSLGMWEVAPGKELRVLAYDPEKTHALMGLDFSPDGQLLVASTGNELDLWDWSSLTKVATLPTGFCRWVSFSPDGSLWTTGVGGLWQWPVHKEASVLTFGPPTILWNGAPLERAWLSPDGRHLAASNRTSQAAVWDLSNSTTKPVWLNGHRGACFVAGSPDLRWIVTGAFNGRGVRIWELVTGKIVCDLPISGSANVAFTSDAKFLVTSTSADYSCWEVGTWKCRWAIPRSPRGDIPGYMALSPNNKVMAMTYARNLVQLVNLTTGGLLATLQSPSNHEVGWLAFHPDGTKLAVACASHQVQVWDLTLIREELARRNLDWDIPPYATHEATDNRPFPILKVAADRLP